MTASDDTKFERARREAPTRWTAAIARPRKGNDVFDEQGPRLASTVDIEEVLARWAAVDELAGPRNDESPPAPGR